MYALSRGLNLKWLGMLFAIFAGFASFGIGCATQVNAIATVCNENFGIPMWIVGIIVAIPYRNRYLRRYQIHHKRMRNWFHSWQSSMYWDVSSFLVMNYDYIIPALGVICKGIYARRGGQRPCWYRYQNGDQFVAKRSVSNESGLGSAPIAAAAARDKNPVRQALVSSTEHSGIQ